MQNHLIKLYSVVVTALLLCANSVFAYENGDIIVRAGIATVNPDDDSTTLSLNGVSLAGTSVSVDNDTQLGLTVAMMLSEHWGLELLAATPFKHTVTAHGLGPKLDVADVKHLPPTLSVQYFPASPSSAFQPYFGAGLNYTVFFSEDLTSEFEGALGTGDIELDSSTGLALEVGFDYQLSDKLLLNAALWKIDLETSATIDLDGGSTIRTDVDIDPWAFMVSLGYKF